MNELTIPGRPVDFAPEVGDEVCRRLHEGQNLDLVCHAPNMPRRATVLGWAERDAAFRDALEAAMRHCADSLADEILSIADGRRTLPACRDPTPKEALGRDRLRIETRKWLAARLWPDKYAATPGTGEADLAELMAAARARIQGRNREPGP